MGNKIEVDRDLLEDFLNHRDNGDWYSGVWVTHFDKLRALLAAPAVEPQACATELMKIAADLANRKPLSQLYRICETQGRISAESLHEHLDKAGDLLAGIALDIRHALAKTQHQGAPVAWRQIGPAGETSTWWDGAPTPEDIENVRAEAETIELAYGPLTDEGTKAAEVVAHWSDWSMVSVRADGVVRTYVEAGRPTPVAGDEPPSRDYPHGESFYRNKDAD